MHHVAHLKLRLSKEVSVFLADQQTRKGQQIFLNMRPKPRRQRLGLGFLFGRKWRRGHGKPPCVERVICRPKGRLSFCVQKFHQLFSCSHYVRWEFLLAPYAPDRVQSPTAYLPPDAFNAAGPRQGNSHHGHRRCLASEPPQSDCGGRPPRPPAALPARARPARPSSSRSASAPPSSPTSSSTSPRRAHRRPWRLGGLGLIVFVAGLLAPLSPPARRRRPGRRRRGEISRPRRTAHVRRRTGRRATTTSTVAPELIAHLMRDTETRTRGLNFLPAVSGRPARG